MGLPNVTAGKRTWKYPQSKGPIIVQVLDVAHIKLASGCQIEVPLDETPYGRMDIDEIRGLCEYMERERMISLREITSATPEQIAEYNAVKLNTTLLKDTVLAVAK